MGLVEQIKDQVKVAMKAKDDVTKNVLRTVLGEVGTLEMSANQAGKPISDDQVHRIIRKVQTSNTETLGHLRKAQADHPILPQEENIAVLERENQILESFLPKLLTRDEIKAKLAAVDLASAKSEGQAVGLAMKYFRESGEAVDGNEVKAAVAELRA
jgi:uncharacterized protein YqeY